MTPDESLDALHSEFAFEPGAYTRASWEEFRSILRGLCPTSAFAEWGLRVRPESIDDQRALWACRDRDTEAVASALGRGLLRDEPAAHLRLTRRAMNMGLGWDGTRGALKIYAAVRPATLRYEEIAKGSAALPSTPPPIEPTVTVGFARSAGAWRGRHYLFWKHDWMNARQRAWLEPILGRRWTEVLAREDRGGFIVRETGEIDVAIGLTRGRLEDGTPCDFAPVLEALVGRESRLAGRLHMLTWITAPLSRSPGPGELRDFNLYLRPDPAR